MISINYRDPRPIYEQIRDELQKLILTGVLPPGEKLPSVRELAQELAINPNTIQRAYRELEQAGFIYSVPGKGSFAGKLSGVDEGRRRELREKLVAVWTELLQLGEEPEELQALLKETVGGGPWTPREKAASEADGPSRAPAPTEGGKPQ